MVRISKQSERRQRNPKRRRFPSPKTGPLEDNLPLGFKEHTNSIIGDSSTSRFIPKVR